MGRMKLTHISSQVFTKHRRIGLIIAVLMTVMSLYSITKLDVISVMLNTLPDNDVFLRRTRELNKYFAASDFIILSIEKNEDDSDTVRRIERLSKDLKGISGVRSIISPTTIKDLTVTEEEISFTQLFTGSTDPDSLNRLDRLLRENILFRKFLLSRDEKAYSIYIFPEKGADSRTLVRDIENAVSRSGVSSAHIIGDYVFRYQIRRNTLKDLITLGTIALILIYLTEIVIGKSIAAGSALLLNSILPTLYILGLLPILGIKLEYITTFVPIIIIALSTSYGIHLYRYHVLGGFGDMTDTLQHATPVIAYASLTTMLGFSTMLLSRVKELRTFGALLVAGIALSALVALFVLPALLTGIKPKKELIHVSINFFSHSGVRKLPIFIILVLSAAAGIGIARIGYDYRIGYFFKRNNPFAQTIHYFYKRYGGIDQLEVIIDTGREYGLVNSRMFEEIKTFTGGLERYPSIGQVISFVDFVEYANGKMNGLQRPKTPESNEEIGEALEILSSGDIGLGMDSFIDAQYTRAKVILRFGNMGVSSVESGKTLTDIENKIHDSIKLYMPGIRYDVTGIPIQNKRSLLYLIRGQLYGILFFFFTSFALFVALFRSMKFAILPLVTTAIGVIFYFGFMGWARIPLTHTTSMSIAALMGVSVDDTIYLVLFFQGQLKRSSFDEALIITRRQTGAAIIQTTAIIVIGLSVFLLSTFSTIFQSGLLIMYGLTLCTLVTLFVVPELIRALHILPTEQEILHEVSK